MKYHRLLETSQTFWKAYEQALANRDAQASITNETERLRYLVILGLTGLDAGVAAYWHARILPEWSELLSLINIFLESEEDFRELSNFAGEKLSRSQLKASLRFMEHTGEPEKFSPTFTDCGILLLLVSYGNDNQELFHSAAEILFRLQKIRNAAVHVGRDFNTLHGNEALFLINQWMAIAARLHPAFKLLPLQDTKLQKAA